MLENEEQLNEDMKKMQEADKPVPEEKPEQQVEIVTEEQKKDEPEQTQEEKREKHWAIDAMHEERSRRKEEAAQRRELELKVAKMEERFTQVMEQRPKQPEVRYDENPAEYLRTRQEETDKQLAELTKDREALQQNQEVQQQQQAFQREFETTEDEFRRENKDYDDAVKFLYDKRIKDYQAMGYSQNDALQLTTGDAWRIAYDAVQRGRNGAETFYQLAKNNGYQLNAKEETSELQQLAEVKDKAEKSQSLGAGGNTPQRITLSELATLDDQEFDRLTSGDNWRKMAGG